MSNFSGFTPDQRYRAAWRIRGEHTVRSSRSMTQAEAQAEKVRQEAAANVTECWIEEYNGWEWERV